MRKMLALSLIAATLVPASAMAQSRGEIRRDRQDVRQEQRELDRAYRSGDRRDIREERRDVRDARQEYREDWRDYRRGHAQQYRRGHWNAPFRYQRFNVGGRLQPSYYGSRYVISNPDYYRLPRAYAGTRWVRHYDDVLLVDVRTGRVRNVIRGFYW